MSDHEVYLDGFADAVERCAKVADSHNAWGTAAAIRALSPQAGAAEGARAYGTDLGKRYDAMPTPPTESAALAEKVPCARCDKNSVAEAHSRNCPIRVRERAERQAAAHAPWCDDADETGGATPEAKSGDEKCTGCGWPLNHPAHFRCCPTPPTESAAPKCDHGYAPGTCPHWPCCRPTTESAAGAPVCAKCGRWTVKHCPEGCFDPGCACPEDCAPTAASPEPDDYTCPSCYEGYYLNGETACPACGADIVRAASPEPPCSKCGSTTEPRSACAGCRKVFCRPCAEKPYAFCCDGRASPEGEGAPQLACEESLSAWRDRATVAEADLERYRMRLAGALAVAEGCLTRAQRDEPGTLEYLRRCPTIEAVLTLRERVATLTEANRKAEEALLKTRWLPEGQLTAWVQTGPGQNHAHVMDALAALRSTRGTP